MIKTKVAFLKGWLFSC